MLGRATCFFSGLLFCAPKPSRCKNKKYKTLVIFPEIVRSEMIFTSELKIQTKETNGTGLFLLSSINFENCYFEKNNSQSFKFLLLIVCKL